MPSLRNLLIFMGFILSSFAAESLQAATCEHFLAYQKKEVRVWDTVTRRTSVEVLNRLTFANRSSLKGVRGSLPPFSTKAVLSGEKSLLSLGEGLSQFVSGYLETNPRLSVHAVDMIYGDSEEFAVELGDAMVHFQVEQMLAKYPGHYHAQYYQNLDVLGLRFDEVVSSHSLAYILDAAKVEQDLELLRTVVKSLTPGGVLRFWPVRPDMYGHVQLLAERLMIEGWLMNHNRVKRWRGLVEEPDADAVVVFQRK